MFPGIALAIGYAHALWRWNDLAQLATSVLFLLGIFVLRMPEIGNDEPTDRNGGRALIARSPSRLDRLFRVVGVGVWLAVMLGLIRLAILPTGVARDILNSPRAMAGIRLAPFLGGLGLAIGAAATNLSRYRRELRLLFFLGVPSVCATWFVDLAPTTARFAGGILQLAGYAPQRDGLLIALPGGAVRVYAGCSGQEAICYLLGLSILCLTVFPTGRRHYVWLPAVAMAIAFVTNGVRVALMAVLAARQDHAAFEYWHRGEGSRLFGMISVSLLGLIYTMLLIRVRATHGSVARRCRNHTH